MGVSHYANLPKPSEDLSAYRKLSRRRLWRVLRRVETLSRYETLRADDLQCFVDAEAVLTERLSEIAKGLADIIASALEGGDRRAFKVAASAWAELPRNERHYFRFRLSAGIRVNAEYFLPGLGEPMGR